MLETIRRYWIGMLVLVLVVLHASIVGVIRYQASLAKMDISCEVALGEFVAYRTKSEHPIEMNLHAIVPQKHRMKSRQLIELNQAQVRQSLEEHLRQIDSRLLADPYLTDLRSQLLEVLTQTLGGSVVEDVVATRIKPLALEGGIEFLSTKQRPEPRKLVATLRGEEETEESELDSFEGVGEDDETHHAATPAEHHPPKKSAPKASAPKKPASSGAHH
jgi:hypothetical protein